MGWSGRVVSTRCRAVRVSDSSDQTLESLLHSDPNGSLNRLARSCGELSNKRFGFRNVDFEGHGMAPKHIL